MAAARTAAVDRSQEGQGSSGVASSSKNAWQTHLDWQGGGVGDGEIPGTSGTGTEETLEEMSLLDYDDEEELDEGKVKG
ncbi:hypothetical protein NDU88_003516 [Pleurodeles waltl]|uniref:Uncharacterized protein n=1 Tax=Pleurodeles waltl TaxID=8319 RepID=A0AAV7QF41_PLEWA|nr:hypothetical protein NDU88_003516 [Pleurodeles waltl]